MAHIRKTYDALHTLVDWGKF